MIAASKMDKKIEYRVKCPECGEINYFTFSNDMVLDYKEICDCFKEMDEVNEIFYFEKR